MCSCRSTSSTRRKGEEDDRARRRAGIARHFALLRSWPEYTLVEAKLKAGRTHQIRVHFSHLGSSIAGDDKHGDFARNKELAKRGLKRMFLHAHSIAFNHPLTANR